MRISRAFILLGALCCTLPAIAPAEAQTARYVSSSGSDANDCSRTTPCLTLQRGVDVTPNGGLLQILDTGAYGPATVVRTVTISGEGISAAVGRITINATSARVVLRGLLLKAAGAAGVTISAASSVHIVRCEVEGFLTGIFLNSTAGSELFVTDSIVRNNGMGLRVIGGPDSFVSVDGSRFENNTAEGISISDSQTSITRTIVSGNKSDGIDVSGLGGHTSLTNTTVTNNAGHGIRLAAGRMSVDSTTSSHNLQNGYYAIMGAEMTLMSSTASHNVGHGYAVSGAMSLESSTASANVKHGLAVLNGSIVVVSNSVFTRNQATGIQNGGTVLTRRNNTVIANVPDLAGNSLETLAGR